VTTDAAVWAVAAVEVVAAGVIGVFWITWFRKDHDADWLPDGYADHEAPFVFSDSLLALLLVVAAVMQVLEDDLGRSLALVCAGMLAFLGILDAGYFVRTGMFARERDGASNLTIVVAVLGLALFLFIRFA
jgi:hypothetical protein